MSPLVEISDHNFGSCVFMPIQYIDTEKQSGLVTPLDEARSKMNIEYVQHRAAGQH